MKTHKILLLSIVVLTFTIKAKGTNIELIKLAENTHFSWNISNTHGHLEFSSHDFPSNEICHMELADEEKFFFNISIDEIAENDSNLALLRMNGAAIMLIGSAPGEGEFSYPFFTGRAKPVLKIIGGEDASIADFPWQVYFRSGNFLCGGSIISKRWILTAAHCTQDGSGTPIAADAMFVKVGTSTPYEGASGKWYAVKSYTIHEDYDINESLLYDIAVLELNEEIDFANAEAIELISTRDVANGATDPGVFSSVTGWGLSNVDPREFPETLQEVELPIVSGTMAREVWGNVHPDFLMAGYRDGGKDACNGDSGGPLVVEVNGNPKLAGIVSWGSRYCNTYGGFTRVSSYLDWIERQTGISTGTLQGDTLICQGDSASRYTVDGAPADTYEWTLTPYNAGVLIPQNDTVTVMWDSHFSGLVELQVSREFEDETATQRTLEINVLKTTKVISFPKDTMVCVNNTVRLEVLAEGSGLFYHWYKDSTFLLSSENENSLSFSADSSHSGSYYCVVEGDCGSDFSGTFNVVVCPPTSIDSITEDLHVEQDEDVSINVRSSGHRLSYQWYKNEQLIVGATDSVLSLPKVKASDTGEYYAVARGDCLSDTSETVYLYVNLSASIQEHAHSHIWPAFIKDDLFTIICEKTQHDLTIYDLSGKLIHRQNCTKEENHVNTSAWPTGVYIVNMTSNDFIETHKVIKE